MNNKLQNEQAVELGLEDSLNWMFVCRWASLKSYYRLQSTEAIVGAPKKDIKEIVFWGLSNELNGKKKKKTLFRLNILISKEFLFFKLEVVIY